MEKERVKWRVRNKDTKDGKARYKQRMEVEMKLWERRKGGGIRNDVKVKEESEKIWDGEFRYGECKLKM